MNLREGEKILKIYHHHPTPFFIIIFWVVLGVLPFYAFLLLMSEGIPSKIYFLSNIILSILFLLVVLYESLVYWLDKLVITNQRVCFLDYKYLTVKDDSFIEIEDIQEIKTKEHGLLAYFWFFDYGDFIIETSSSTISIIFPNAPSPENIRQFLFHIKAP